MRRRARQPWPSFQQHCRVWAFCLRPVFQQLTGLGADALPIAGALRLLPKAALACWVMRPAYGPPLRCAPYSKLKVGEHAANGGTSFIPSASACRCLLSPGVCASAIAARAARRSLARPGVRRASRCVRRSCVGLPMHRLIGRTGEHRRVRVACEAVGPERQVLPQQCLINTRVHRVDPSDRRRLDLVIYSAMPLGRYLLLHCLVVLLLTCRPAQQRVTGPHCVACSG